MIRRLTGAARWFFSRFAQTILRTTLASSSIGIGLTWIFGGVRTHSSLVYSVWNELGVSWVATGLWAIASGVLILIPYAYARLVGYLLGIAFRMTFSGYGLAAFLGGANVGITAFADWGTLAVLHAVLFVAVWKDDLQYKDNEAVKREVDARAVGAR